MRSLRLDIWVKAIDRTPTTKGFYKIKVGTKNPTFNFFDCSEPHKNEWIKLNFEWREVSITAAIPSILAASPFQRQTSLRLSEGFHEE